MELLGSTLTVQNAEGANWLVTVRQQINDAETIEFTLRVPRQADPLWGVQARAIDRAMELLRQIRPGT